MLICESEGSFEVEDENIRELYRSSRSVTITSADNVAFELHGLLCKHQVDDDLRCHVAFFCRQLKQAVIFAVKGASVNEQMQQGFQAFSELEMPMEPVNLGLSPAMRQVILRDVPGILSPEQARKQRSERMAMRAELEAVCEETPESTAGKQAKLKLNAEQRLDGQLKTLRELLVARFAPTKEATGDMQALASQVEDLTARLEKTEAALDEERAQREMAAGIAAAAEKRIQELEAVLVDAETRSADTVKQKQKVVQLEMRIRDLVGERDAAMAKVEAERNTQEQLVEDIRAAHARIKNLEQELTEAVEAATGVVDAGTMADQSSAELQQLKAHAAELMSANDSLKQELAASRLEIQTLERVSKNARQVDAAGSQDEQQNAGNRQQFETLEQALETAREELAQERSIRQRLEKGALADQKRFDELELQLKEAETKQPETAAAGTEADAGSEQLKTELQEALSRATQKTALCEELETELDEAHKMIEALEKALKDRQGTVASVADDGQAQELAAQLQAAETQLEQEQIEQKKIAADLSAAEKRIADLEDLLQKAEQQATPSASLAVQKAAGAKPLPHELRSPPKKGATFHPDWDLEGLPCKSADQVLQVWESAFNVQLALEGYPSQYCTAFLVVLKIGKEKRLFMLFRLKKDKHTLVCVPAAAPKDDEGLKKMVQEGLKYLQLSGFEIVEMAKENIAGALGSYFLES